MKTVPYEAVFVIDAATPDDGVKAIIEKYSGVVTHQGGTINDVDRWDPRRLAYEIKRKREGIFVVMNFEATAAAHDELNRIFRISDDVLRHMIVKQDPKADRFPSRARAAEQERREREQAARAAITPAPTPAAPEPITDLSASPADTGVSAEDKAAADATDATATPAAEGEATGGEE